MSTTLKNILTLILIFCIGVIIYGYEAGTFLAQNVTVTIEPESSVQDILPDIICLDTFELPNEVVGNTRLVIIHDNKRNVTCYLYNRMTYGGGISCIPDSEIQPSEIDNNYKRYIAR